MKIVGCDSGVSGAIAFLDTDNGDVRLRDMPTVWHTLKTKDKKGKFKRRRRIDCRQLYKIFERADIAGVTHVMIEKVGSMPHDSSMAAFTFGQAYGSLEGVLGAFNFEVSYCTPQQWKKHYKLIGEGKNGSVIKAKDLYPQAAIPAGAKAHGPCDALLVAGYHAHELA